MSWTNIKKAINRAGTQVKLKTGHIEGTVDQYYEFHQSRFNQLELHSNNLHKHLSQYLDSLRMITTNQENVGQVLLQFYGEGPSFSTMYAEAMEQISHEESGLEPAYTKTIIGPVARFCSYFNDINDAMKKRNKKKLDYDMTKSSVEKMIESPRSSDPDYEAKLGSLRHEHSVAAQSYNELNEQLKIELPQFINLRMMMLNPTFESFVKLQMRYFQKSHEKMEGLGGGEEGFGRMDEVLGRMKELNIA